MIMIMFAMIGMAAAMMMMMMMTLLTRRGPGKSGLHTWSSGAPNFTLGGKGSWLLYIVDIFLVATYPTQKLFFVMLIKRSVQVCQHSV